MSTISYVLPVYNNAGSIRLSCDAIHALFDGGALAGHDYEILLVNDGSRDGSLAEMREAAAADPRVRTIDFSRNFGQLAAIIAGYDHARGDAVINMSADLQDPVELTVEMVQAWQAGSDVVIGHREAREDSFGARLFSRLAYGAVRAGNANIPAGGFDFVLMSRKALTLFLSLKGRNRFFQGDVVWAGLPTTFLPYVRRARTIGKSQYTFSKKLKLFYDFVLDGSYLPIRLMSACGAAVALLGVLYAIAIVVAWTFGDVPFSGWAPIMVAVLLIGGMIMLMLGMMGEYLWRILDEVKAKPLYVVRDES
ncbi:putative glycosyltransferase YkcC [Lysobacter helvus]|uniref:Glycosyltransferase YkcC n=2 Tax=Lysobacteraceae TaxID=32033 RepID=A0ABM7Q3J2_9GAMM|nr:MULTISPECIES: glycosyltransferase family 2 protein [Lysobacter]BCT91849.1 putative glycosyltransferase YkcC [Lysobacter caseinilyticus]BCT95002.1 putative glycosyltransferase YkcC [Lysobacter helvus]